MKILVTGGSGYIGSNLNLLSFEKGFFKSFIDVDICDYYNDNMKNLYHRNLPLAQDLSYNDVNEYDGVVHLAALSGLAACEEDSVDAVEKNIITAMNVFKQATYVGIPVVFTSSQAAKDPLSSKYAFIKWTCEQMAEVYNKSGGMNYVLRLSNVYGGHHYLEKKQTCVKQFITRYKENKPLIVHGDGTQKRDFIHVWDVCSAIVKILEKKPSMKGPIDIGTGIGTSIMELREMFSSLLGPIDYEFKKIRNVGTDSSIANVSQAKKLIGFKAKRRLKDYIKEMK